MSRPRRPESQARRPTSPGRRRPSLEALEHRLVMAAPTLSAYLDVGFLENTVNAVPQPLNAGATVGDAEQDWAGGTLTVSGLLTEDRLGFLAAGGVARVGNDLLVDGTTIGSVGSGAGQTGVGEPLVVTFNDSASNAGVQAVVRALAYQNASDFPTPSRRLTVVLTDAAGGRSTPGRINPDYSLRGGVSNPLPSPSGAIHSDPTLGDLDGDGDLDLVIGVDAGNLLYFTNVGTATAPAFAEQVGALNPFDGINVGVSSSPVLGDFDGDGDLDLVVANSDGVFRYYLNTGTASSPTFVEQAGGSNPFGEVSTNGYGRPSVADIDDDGDLDLISGETSGVVRFYLNTGTSAAPVFVEQTGSANPFAGISLPIYSDVAFGDIDGDGLVDFILGGDQLIRSFRNIGTASTPAFVELTGANNPFADLDFDIGIHATLADLDGDAQADAVVGNFFGEMQLAVRDRFTLEVTVTPEAEVPPTLVGGTAPMNYRLGGPAVSVDPNLVINNPSGANLTTASVSIGANFTASEDRLSFDDRDGIAGSYNAQTGILTLTGSATAAQYQAALRSVRYQNLNGDVATANRAPRSFSFSIAPGTFNPANGHFYEFVAARDIRWTEARVAAEGRSIFGTRGYLATITSSDENTFAFSKIQSAGWIGGSDAGEEGVWRWVVGPEAGTQFAQGVVSFNGQYVNWGPGQPDNAQSYVDGTFENYAQFDALGRWNDLPDFDPWSAPYGPIEGYLVEYGGMPDDPTLQLTSQATVAIVVATDAPTVSGPATPLVVNTPTAVVAGTAEPGSLVRVYRDANNNGILDEGDSIVGSQQLEPGQAAYSIAVGLAPDAANDFLVTATLAGQGEVESDPVDVPTVVSDATAPPAPTTTSPAAPAALNASTATIAGSAEAGSLVQVYDDANGNGVLDDGEAIVGSQQLEEGQAAFNITVPLARGAANRFLVVATDAVGNRSTPAVVPAILQDATSPVAPTVAGPATPATVNSGTFTIAGTAEPGSLVKVYRDRDGDGSIGEGDEVVGVLQLGPGQSTYAITVPLAAGSRNRFLVTSTDAAGNASTPAAVPAIVQDSTAPAPPVVSGPSSPVKVDAASAEIAGTAEAGSLVAIFADANGDGVIDAGDPIVGSVQLDPGQTEYRITIPLARGAANRFLVSATDAAGNRSIPAAVPTITAEAGAPLPAAGRSSLGGRLFDDIDGDGIQDPGEPGLANLTIILEGTDVDGNPARLVATTNADGSYLFSGLRPGVYSLILPGGEAAAGVAGSLGGTSRGGRIDGIVVGDGSDGVGYAFAARVSKPQLPVDPAPQPPVGPAPTPTTGRLGGRVYLDRNRNGVYDAGRDLGIATIRVILTGVDDQGRTVRLVTTTDATGAYLFEGLRPGSYSVQDARTRFFRDTRTVGNARARVAAQAVAAVAVEAGVTSQVDLGKLPAAGCRLIPLMGPGGINRPVPRGPLFQRFFPTASGTLPSRSALRLGRGRLSAARHEPGHGQA